MKLLNNILSLFEDKTTIVELDYLRELEEKAARLEKDNERMMMTFYSAKAAREIMDEIREILNAPPPVNITEVVKQLKEEQDA